MGLAGNQFVVGKIVGRWRRLTGGSAVRDPDRPTLVALSGGPDSSALLIALASVNPARIVAAHIKHNLRPDALQNQDAKAARLLAEQLGVEFHESEITIPDSENAEAGARTRRYDQLAEIARASGCSYIATGHHAQDQLETMLMALIRGTGLAGLAGIADSRELTDQVTLVRPALTTARSELESLCRSIGFTPAHDETNDDTTRQRAWLRSEILPSILEHSDDDLPDRLASASGLLSQAQSVIEDRVDSIVSHAKVEHDSICIQLDAITNEQPIVIGQVVRQLSSRLVGEVGADARGLKHLSPIIEAVSERSMHTKTFELRGLVVEVSNKQLTICVSPRP